MPKKKQNISKITTEVINISKDSKQTNAYNVQNLISQNVAQPIFSKSTLYDSYRKSNINNACINLKAKLIGGFGYEFEDEDNAEKSGVKNFLKSIRDKNGNPISFESFLVNLCTNWETFGEWSWENYRVRKEIVNIYVLSGKNLYQNRERTKFFQVNQINNEYVTFSPYSKDRIVKQEGTATDIYYYRNSNLLDDYYGVPDYVAGLTTIELQEKQEEEALSFLNNRINPSYVIQALGGVLGVKEEKELKEQLKNLKDNNGAVLWIRIAGENIQVKVDKVNNDAPIESSNAKSDSYIMALHNIAPAIFELFQTGGITSGEQQKGVLRQLLETTIKPKQAILEAQLDRFFSAEFEGYNTKIQLKTISLEDEVQKHQLEQIKAQTYREYINIGSLELVNEYRKALGYDDLTEQEWSKILNSGYGAIDDL